MDNLVMACFTLALIWVLWIVWFATKQSSSSERAKYHFTPRSSMHDDFERREAEESHMRALDMEAKMKGWEKKS